MGLGRVINKLSTSVPDDNYEHSRRTFIVEGCIANGIYTLTSGAFLVGYASYLGASDQFNGILVSLPLLTNIIQMFSPIILERLSRRKKLLVSLLIFYRILLGLMVLIPVLTEDKFTRLLLLGIIYFTAYLAAAFQNPGTGSWIISLVPENMRGRYFGVRDMCMLASAAALSIIMGRVLDILKAYSMEYIGFIVVFSVVFTLIILNFIMLKRIKEPDFLPFKQKLKLGSMLVMPVKDKNFRKVIFLNLVWNVCAQIAIPFFSVYMVTGLKLSYTFIMAMSIIISAVQAMSAKIWGRISDKVGWEFTTVTSIGMISICHITWIFVNQNTYFILIPIIQIVAGMAWAGINLSLFNIQFKYAPLEGRTVYIGFNAALSGLAGFFSALFGAVLVGALSGLQLDLGITVLDNMLFIFGFSGILTLCCAIFFSFWFKRGRK